MTYSILNPQPASGLEAGEVAVTLDTGDIIAVACTTRRMVNAQGVEFNASARAINADGTPRTCGCNQPIATAFPQPCTPQQVSRFGVDALAKEHVLAVLGEPPTLVDLYDDNGDPVLEADGVTHKQVPMLGALDPLVADQVSMRHALSVVAALADCAPLASLLA